MFRNGTAAETPADAATTESPGSEAASGTTDVVGSTAAPSSFRYVSSDEADSPRHTIAEPTDSFTGGAERGSRNCG